MIRKNIYFVFYKEPPRKHDIIIQYDFDTNEEICRYTTIGEASRKTGVSDSTISAQIKIGHKPKWSRSDYYFQKNNNILIIVMCRDYRKQVVSRVARAKDQTLFLLETKI